jgi:pyruvate formate lyase activating enzyme
MIIGGFQKFSLTDFPGKTSAIVFTRGCNFKCSFCHNPELVDPDRYAVPISEAEIRSFLRNRKNQLQGVVVTGGEPTIHPDLPDFLSRLKKLGFPIKLDTNGSHPEMIRSLFSDDLIDYIAMDIKAPLSSYERIVNSAVSLNDIQESIRLIISSTTPHEFRTTYLDTLLSLPEMKDLGLLVAGCTKYFIQPFTPTKAINPALLQQGQPSLQRLEEIQNMMTSIGIPCSIR